jgi:hypothetical protein
MPGMRIIALNVAAAVAGITLGALLYLTCERGNNSKDAVPLDDPRTRTVLAFVPLVVERYALGGAVSLYEFTTEEVREKCSVEEFRTALEGEIVPRSVRWVESVSYNDDGTAEVRSLLVTTEGDVEATWKVEFTTNRIAQILEVPGSEECTP